MTLPARLAVAAAALLAGAFAAAAPSTSVAVSGAVDRPTAFTAASLATLPQVTQTDSFASGGGAQAHTWTGPTLWNVLDATGIRTRLASNLVNLQVFSAALMLAGTCVAWRAARRRRLAA